MEFIGQKHPSFGEEATSKLNLNAPGWSSVAAWLDSVPSEKTQRNYETMFGIFWEYATENHFRGFIDSPDALVSHRFKESKLDAEDPASFYSESVVEAWHKKLKADGLADRTAQGYVGVVRSFFNHATRGKASLKLRILYRHKRVRFKYTPTQPDLDRLRLNLSPRHWALVAAMKDSGFGPDQMTHIKWGQIIRDLDHGDFWFVSGQREKTDEEFATFFGPDATKAIRAVYGDGPHDGNMPIFIGEYGKPISSEGISAAIKRAVVAAGFTKEDRTKNFTAYSLRAFFNTQMETARVPDNWRKSMMGHSLGRVQGAYSRPHVEELLKTYKAAYKHLTIEGLQTEAMSADDMATFERAKGGDPLAIAAILKKFGEDHELSRLLKDQISKHKKEQISAKPDKTKPKKGQRMVIDASEIGNHCSHGWKAIFQFQDGRVQVEYEGDTETTQ